MTKTNKSSQQTFIKTVKHAAQNHPNTIQKVLVELAWDESQRVKGLHDLHAAAQAFQAMIALEEAKNLHPDERQIRKYTQLRLHAERLENLVDWVEDMIDQKQAQE